MFIEHIPELRPLEKNLGHLEEFVKNVKDSNEYDSRFTAPAFGYSTANDYYRRSSSVLVLNDIKIPMLFINSLDDPVVRYIICIVRNEVIPYDECKANPNIILGTFPSSGHIGFFSGLKPKRVLI